MICKGCSEGRSISLTAGADTLSSTATDATKKLTSGNDAITGGINTLNANDSIVDASTSDSDTLSVELVADVDSTVTITNIETITVDALSGPRTVDNSKITGVKTIESKSTGGLVLTNVQSSTTAYKLTGTASDLTVSAAAAAVTGGADSANVTLSGVTAGTVTVNGAFEAVKLTSSGTTSNTLTNVAAASATSLTVDGGSGIKIGNATNNVGTNFATIDARSAGATDIRLAPNTNQTLLTGSTNDTVTLTTALQTTHLVSMGSGTDTLILETSTGNNAAVLKGIENIKTTGGAATAIDMANADTAASFDIAHAATSFQLSNLAAGTKVKTTATLGTGGADIKLLYKATVMNEALNLDIQKAGAFGANNIEVANLSDLTITTGGAFTQTATNVIKVDASTDTTDVTKKLTLVNTSTGGTTFGIIEASSGAGNATQLTDLTLTQSGTGGTLAAAAVNTQLLNHAGNLTNYTINATAGQVTAGIIGTGTAAAKLNTVTLDAAGGNILSGAIKGGNAAGISSVALKATGGTINQAAATAFAISNAGGDIKAVSVTGSKDVNVDFTTTTSGKVLAVDASAHTGQFVTTITNVGTSGTGSNVTLGNAVAGKTNQVTLAGAAVAVADTVTGGTGSDTIINATKGNDSITGGDGAGVDTISFAGTTAGKIINVSGSTEYLNGKTSSNATAADTVAAGKAYDSSSGSVDTSASASTVTLSGFEKIIGTSNADIIFLASASQTVTGGAGADVIKSGAAIDTFVFNAGDSSLTIDSTDTANSTIVGFDKISSFALAGGDILDLIGTPVLATTTAGASSTASTGLLDTGTAVKSHAIAATGEITFDDVTTFASAVTLSGSDDVAAVVQYLQGVNMGDGKVVWFKEGSDTYIFQQGTDADNTTDVLVQLTGVTATSIILSGTTAGGVLIG